MAAAIWKKRAVAEYSQVIQEEPKPKRLKLTRAADPEIPHLNLQNVSSEEGIQELLRFQRSLPVDGELAAGLVGELVDYFHREREASVRSCVAMVLASLTLLPNFNSFLLVDHLLALLLQERSHQVLSQLIKALYAVGRSLPGNHTMHTRIVNTAIQHLRDSSHQVRSSCLALIGGLAESSCEKEDGTIIDMLQLLNRFLCDQDPRVRSAAFKAMLSFHQRGISLSMESYQQACAALSDDYECVRSAAMHLIWVLCHLFPEKLVIAPDANHEELRLVDDGFAKICNMMNDISVRIRTEAASLLGSLHLVSRRFLEQTLDKKLMSNMRVKKSAHERARENFQSGEWSSGQKWADDAPREEVNPEDVNLINMRACGAFVHGLEDEFLEVRNAALDSLCELASQSPHFAVLSQDHIIDMFNDEIDSVRLNAINSLRKISSHVVLQEAQLEIILAVLQEASFQTREELRDMLCEMRVATQQCLNACVKELLKNLKRYPQDRASVWKCAQYLGKHHPQLTLMLAPELLSIHPYFVTPEPDVEDPSYVAVVALIFNAAEHCPTMGPLFPPHVRRHYTYLRTSLPHIIPNLPELNQETKERSVQEQEQDSQGTEEWVATVLGRLGGLGDLDLATAISLLEPLVRDLQTLTGLDQRRSASVQCLTQFLQSQLIISQVMLQIVGVEGMEGGISLSDNMITPLEKALTLTSQLQTLFLGLRRSELCLVRQAELKIATIMTLLKLQKSSLVAKLQAANGFTTYLQQSQGTYDVPGVVVDAFTKVMMKSKVLEKPESGLMAVSGDIQDALPLIRPVSFSLSDNVRQAKVTIHEPPPNSDKPIKFASNLTASFLIDLTVENFSSPHDLRIQVRYADQTVLVFPPPPRDWRKLSPLRHRLVSEVVLSHGLWSEPSQVEVTLVVEAMSAAKKLHKRQYLDVSDTIKVLLAPREIRRS